MVNIVPLPDDFEAYSLWWSYSLALGIFFVTLPYSRYMHIPTEILLIFYRHLGIQPKKWYSSFSDTEVHACSRCGVCLDVCQMNDAGIFDSQTVYFIEGVRNQYVPEEITSSCLVCGRCQEVCPVGIHSDSLRLLKRRELYSGHTSEYSFLASTAGPGDEVAKNRPDVAYFAGCMSHLTPSIIRAMHHILQRSGVSFIQLDRDRSICCGRPLKIAGKDRQAHELVEINKKLIVKSRAGILVTSCPICYRVFREEYNLPVRVMHHTQLITDLIKKGKLPLQATFPKAAYHDPCDLGRGSGIYQQPRETLSKVADLVPVDHEKRDALCCGGSLGMLNASQSQRDAMTQKALETLTFHQPDLIVTACPLCKKTFASGSKTPVADIAELVSRSIPA